MVDSFATLDRQRNDAPQITRGGILEYIHPPQFRTTLTL